MAMARPAKYAVPAHVDKETAKRDNRGIMRNAIVCKNLFKRYESGEKAVDAVNGLDLEVHTGECFGLLGPSGAGRPVGKRRGELLTW